MSTISERNESATTQYPFPLSTIKQLTRERDDWERTAIERTNQLAQSQARLEAARTQLELANARADAIANDFHLCYQGASELRGALAAQDVYVKNLEESNLILSGADADNAELTMQLEAARAENAALKATINDAIDFLRVANLDMPINMFNRYNHLVACLQKAAQPPAPITLCACGDDLSRHSDTLECRDCECHFYRPVSADSPMLNVARAAVTADVEAAKAHGVKIEAWTPKQQARAEAWQSESEATDF